MTHTTAVATCSCFSTDVLQHVGSVTVGCFVFVFFLFERSSRKTHLRLLLLDLRERKPGSVRVHLNGVLFADVRSRLTVIVNKEELLSGGGFFSFFF